MPRTRPKKTLKLCNVHPRHVAPRHSAAARVFLNATFALLMFRTEHAKMTSRTWLLGSLILALQVAAVAQPQPLRIGQSAGLTGGQAAYSKDVKTGIEAALAAANKQGGVNGRCS
jgi:ABC-type branched-subunit amino acid transport system substrate-binding protein